MRRIGIVGGTFDPPHYAHLVLAEHAHEELALDLVLFVPAGQPPHKASTRTPLEHRVAMLERALSDNDKFRLSRVDIDRPGPHYTVDMINLLREHDPGAELIFIMGEDMFNSLPRWERAEALFMEGQLPVAVMRRLGERGTLRPDKHHEVFPGLERVVTMLKSPLLEVSSTDIVRRLQEGRSVRYLLPDPVLDYIYRHDLYVQNPADVPKANPGACL